MKKISFLFLFCFTIFSWQSNAQQECGIEDLTPEDAAQLLLDVQSMSMGFVPGDEAIIPVGPITVPFQPHIIRDNAGTGGADPATVLANINAAALHYLPYGILLDIKPILYVDRTDLLTLGAVGIGGSTEGDANLPAYNVANHANAYFIPTILSGSGSGNPIGGYARFPWMTEDYFTVANGNLEPNGATVAHEMGHYFGLLHTFEPFYGLELVNGSNCGTTGDLLCDTPADGRHTFSDVNSGTCAYSQGTDANGDAYAADETQIMSYNQPFSCVSNFSAEAEARMRFYMGNDFPDTRSYLFSPTAVCMNTSVTLNVGGTATITAADVDGGSSDPNGSTLTPSVSPSSFTSANLGANTVTLTITNSNGFTTTCTATVTVLPNPVPGNDDCADAIGMNYGDTLSGNTTAATFDGVGFCGTSNTAAGVWYTFVGDGNNTNITTCSPSTNYDTKLTVFSGSCASLTCEGGNDDDFSCSSSILQSSVEICTTSGTTYYVLVHGFSSGTGDFDLTLTSTPSGPSISCPGNITQNNDPSVCGAVVNYTTPVGSDDCPGAITTQTAGFASGETFPIGITTNTFLVTDASGATASCSFTVTVTDTEPPTMNVPANITVNNDTGQCGAVVTWPPGDLSADDNCGISSITQTTGTFSGDVFPVGTTTNTYVTLDNAGLSATNSFTVTVIDAETPVISCVASSPTTVTGNNNTAVDFVDSAIVTTTVPISGIPVGASILDVEIDLAINHTWVGDLAIEIVAPTGDAITILKRPGINFPNPQEIGDCCGNNADLVSSSPITFRDTSSNDPELMGASGNIICQQDGLCDYFPNADDGGASTSSMAFFAQAITASGIDANGNWTINILDGAAGDTGNFTIPELRVTYLGTSLIRETDPGVCTYTVQGTEFDATFTDNCPDGSITNDLNGTATIAGEILPKGDTTVVWTVDDGNGQSATCTTVITVEDNEDPTWVNAPADLTVECDGAGNTTDFSDWLDNTFTGTDNCPNWVITNDSTGLSDDCGETGTETVTFTLTDESGNFIELDATFTIEDTVDPFWDVAPSDLTVECDGAGNTAEFDAWLNSTFSGSDTCSGLAVVTNNSTGLSDGCGETGTETVTFTLTDDCDNFIVLDATFTIVDTVDPFWDVAPSDLTVECDGAGNTAEFDAWLNNTFSGSDTCSGLAVVTNNSTGLSDGCGETGTETVTFTLTDDCGNFIELDATFTIEDTVDPFWDVAPSDLTVECDGAGNVAEFDAWLNATFSGSDTCSGFATVTNNSTGLSDDCGETGAETVTFTLTDDCGNFIELDATFTIEDTTPAVIGCPGDVIAFTEDGDCGAIVNFQSAVAIEECGDVIVYQTAGFATGSVFPVGDTIIEYTAQDSCGNLSTCEFTITVIDDDAPEAICQNITVELDDMGNATITANQVNFGSVDNCGVDTLEIDIDTFDCSNVGDNDVTLTVTDIHGNTATCIAVVTVVDVTAPEVTCNDITVELDADGTVTIDPMDIAAGSSDACGIASYELNIDTFGCLDVGENTVILTVTDVNGNESSCSATVTVEDNTAPELVCMDVTVELNQDGVAFITPALVADIIDNCGTGAIIIDVEEVSCADIGTPVTVNVFANDGNGNSTVCSAIVTVVDLLGPQIVCPEDEVVNLDPNGTYTLGDYIGDGSATVTDNCTDPVTIFSQDPAPGTILGFGVQVITFTAEDEYGNVSTCSFELDVQEILGTNDGEDFASLVLYPNPADSKVHLSNPRQMDLSEVTIYDLTGRIVNKVDLTNMGSEITIDVSKLANATYMLVIKGEQGTSTKQLIVNNY